MYERLTSWKQWHIIMQEHMERKKVNHSNYLMQNRFLSSLEYKTPFALSSSRVRRVVKKMVSQDYKFIYEEDGLKISKKCLVPLLFVRRNRNASIVLLIF